METTVTTRTIFLGKSPMHAENVALIRNLCTGYLSPQYHVVFDDTFDTIYADEDEPPPEWDDMCIFQRFQVELDEKCTPPRLANEWYSEDELAQQQSSPPSAQPTRRRMYQEMHSKDVRDDLQYQPPPSPNLADVMNYSPPSPREVPPITPREDSKSISDLKNWTRQPPQSSSVQPQTRQPQAPSSSASNIRNQQLPPPRRNPPRNAPRQPLNISSMNTKTYDSPRKHSKLASALVAALSLSAPPTSHLFHAQLTGRT